MLVSHVSAQKVLPYSHYSCEDIIRSASRRTGAALADSARFLKSLGFPHGPRTKPQAVELNYQCPFMRVKCTIKGLFDWDLRTEGVLHLPCTGVFHSRESSSFTPPSTGDSRGTGRVWVVLIPAFDVLFLAVGVSDESARYR